MKATSALVQILYFLGISALFGCVDGFEAVESAKDAGDASFDLVYPDTKSGDMTPDWMHPADLVFDTSREQTDDDTPPTVEFVQPLDGAEVEGVVAIEVDAQDDTGVVSVELFVGGESLGIDEETPYEFQWDATELWSGTYVLKAVALDAAGNAGYATISVTVLGECDEDGDCPPSVGFLTPEAGAYVGGKVEIKASANDDDAVVKVRFLVDEGLLLEDTQVPYKAEWDTTEFDDGAHALALIAYDTTDKTTAAEIEVTVDNTTPEISLLSPEEGVIQHDEILLSVEAADALQMDRVEFTVDDGDPEVVSEEPWEFVFDGSILAAGTHVVEATAFDAAGNEASVTLEFLVDRLPVVAILAPAQGAGVPSPLMVQAEVEDDVGLQTVSLFVDDAWYGDLFSPRGVWEILWTPEYEKAERVLSVVATDSSDQESAAQVTVLVDHPVSIALQVCVDKVCQALEADTELTGTAQLRAVAEDDGAGIVGVDFLIDGAPAYQDLEAPFDFVWDTTSVEDGARLLEAVAKNALDETGAAQVQVQVNNCDLDYDGFAAAGCGGSDCNDGDEEINPSVSDMVGDDADENCDGLDGVDVDGDGHASEASGGDDCDDDMPLVHPCGDDLADDGVDGDCDGADVLSCDDCIVCTVDGLVAGACVHSPVENGGVCDDGDLCTGNGTCQGLVCLPGESLDCDDQEFCTADGCVPETGCYHLPLEGLPCDGGVCFESVCCTPDCDGKECGDDGCGGVCGQCQGATTICEGGICFDPEACGCAPWQTCTLQDGCVDPPPLGESPYGGDVIDADECYGTTWKGCCAGDALYYCDWMSGECPGGAEVCLVKLECGEDGTVCGWSAAQEFFGCVQPPAVPDPQGDLSCDWFDCVPDCAGQVCGPDGCGGSCGSCPLGEECAPDGLCQPAEFWCGNGVCEVPDGEHCLTCFDDCGPCFEGSCCEPHDEPGCGDLDVLECVCELDWSCCGVIWEVNCVDLAGTCGAACTCEPDCTGNTCTDGCGGICEGPCHDGKSCTFNDVCVDGTCLGTLLDCSDGNECTEDFCQEDGGCVSTPLNAVPCWTNGVCVDGECICLPDCEGKECGDDGCGDTCSPGCEADETCVFGVCELEIPMEPGSPLVISEIMYDPAGIADDKGEWIEIYNASSDDIDINGYRLQDGGNNIHIIQYGGPLVIEAGQYFVFGMHGDESQNGGVQMDYVLPYSGFQMDNVADEVILLDKYGQEIDRVEYDEDGGWLAAEGASIALHHPNLDNNSSKYWAVSTVTYGNAGNLGTPGAQNSQ